MLKGYIAQYKHQKEIFDLKERHDLDELGFRNFLQKFLYQQFYRGHICIYNNHNIS